MQVPKLPVKAPAGILRDFRDFILSGNVMDMTIGVLVGSSIAKFSQFLTADLVTPLVTKGIHLVQSQLANAGGQVTGQLTNSAQHLVGAHYAKLFGQGLDLLIGMLSVFVLVKFTNRLRPARVDQQDETASCPFCLMEVPVQAARCGHCTSMLDPHHAPTPVLPVATGPIAS